jgi:hypothetical protein
VRWHASQGALVTTWPAGLPGACLPLWQVAQVPGRTPTWLKRAPPKDAVLWQDSQPCVTGKCPAGMVAAETRLPAV